MDKDQKFMSLAKHLAQTFSKDSSTKVACLIIGEQGETLSTGYNGYCRGADDTEFTSPSDRNDKLLRTIHAETNAILNAARCGAKLLGGKAYITSLPPCIDCSKNLIQVGIKKIYLESWAFDPSNPRSEVWLQNWPVIKEMFDKADVSIEVV